MLSVILYGRNDDHGYNYHKRLAMSLNCIATVLSDPNDEIIFVDYNTQNELPTIIEAIQDTLTPKTRSVLRILRVRPSLHARFVNRSSLPLLEPIARNVAIRRTRPENKWILSTNIDMIFVTENQKESLTHIIASLEDGFYCLPRLEIPESLWELSLERSQPEKNISFLRENSQKLHLNTIVRREGFLQYDNPGDFQLCLRKDLMEIGGFDERMLKGWHVDANLSKRMHLLHKMGPSLEGQIRCYHCNHTQKESFLHSKNRTQNNWHHFVENPSLSPVLHQKNWGLADETIEEISLQHLSKDPHVNIAISALQKEPKTDYTLLIRPESYNHLSFQPARVFTYLADHLRNLPKDAILSYIGCNAACIRLISAYLAEKGCTLLFLKEYINEEIPLSHTTRISNLKSMISQTTLYIFDFGIDENSLFGKDVEQSQDGYQKGRKKIKRIMLDFLKIVKKIKPSSKCIGIHVKHSDFNLIFSKHLAIHLNSHATGISYGYVVKKQTSKPYSLVLLLEKQQLLSYCGYYVTRYLFNYSDRIRKFVLKYI